MVAMLLFVGWTAGAVGLLWGAQRLVTRRKGPGAEVDGDVLAPGRGLGRLRRLMEGSESSWPGVGSEQHGAAQHHGGHGSIGGHHDSGGFGGGGHHG